MQATATSPQATDQELSRQLVRQSAEQLNDDGFATVLCSWTHREGTWEDCPREWVAGLGGSLVATLPILATFLGRDRYEPSPYAPVSRRFWSEVGQPRGVFQPLRHGGRLIHRDR